MPAATPYGSFVSLRENTHRPRIMVAEATSRFLAAHGPHGGSIAMRDEEHELTNEVDVEF